MSKLHVLVDSVSGDQAQGAAPVAYPQNLNRADYGMFQVSVASAGTCTLNGRTSKNMPWVEITNLTATGATRVTLAPQMSVVVSGHDSGVIRAELWEN